MDFFDILLAKKLEDDRDPKVEGLSVTANGTYSEEGVVYKPVVVNVPETPLSSLSVTANGTYTAPSGTAYNEVDVDVPLPENAYLLEEYEDVPTDIASFTASDAPLKSLTASIVPVQAGSGDPSPENIRPFVPWTECRIKRTSANLIGGDLFANAVKNAMPSATIDEAEKTVSFTSSATLDNYIFVDDRTYGDYYIPFKENTSYTFVLVGYNSKSTADASNLRIYYTDGTNTTLSFDSTSATKQTKIYTTPSSKTVNRLSKTNQDGTTVLYYDECGIFEGTITAEEYEPYAGTTTTIPFTDSQGQSVEVFGGSVDVVNGGEQPRTFGSVDLGDLTWTKLTFDNVTYFQSTSLVGLIEPPVNNSTVTSAMASIYRMVAWNSGVTDSGVMAVCGKGDNNEGKISCQLHDYDSYTTEQFKQAMQGKQLVYPLATPTTFYTQPTSIKSLEGKNNVSASTGQIETLEFFTKGTS